MCISPMKSRKWDTVRDPRSHLQAHENRKKALVTVFLAFISQYFQMTEFKIRIRLNELDSTKEANPLNEGFIFERQKFTFKKSTKHFVYWWARRRWSAICFNKPHPASNFLSIWS